MRVSICDHDALRAVSVDLLRIYLNTQGWVAVRKYGAFGSVFSKGENVEILVPNTNTIKDYVPSVSNILKILSDIELRSEVQIYNDIISSDKDVIRIRAPRSYVGGNINFSDGISLFFQSNKLLQSAVNATRKPRPIFFEASKSSDAINYMNNMQLGQTEQGSYILSLLAPVGLANIRNQEQGILWEDEVFERRVTKTLFQALCSAKKAAEEFYKEKQLSLFIPTIQKGVSANLCDALFRLIESGNGIEISFSWSGVRKDLSSRSSVVFEPFYAEIFEEAARFFREEVPREAEIFTAWVIMLERKPHEVVGEVKLKTEVDGHSVTFSAWLQENWYEVAIDAHTRQKQVQVKGQPTKNRKNWILEEVQEFRLVSDD